MGKLEGKDGLKGPKKEKKRLNEKRIGSECLIGKS